MTNIIQFPKLVKAAMPKAKGTGIGAAVLQGVWVLTVLVWPILKWIVSIDCLFQLIRMVYHWDTPGVYAGWTFFLHFTALIALTYFVSLYKPKGI